MASKNTELIREENLRKIEGHMQEIWKLAGSLGLDVEELWEMMKLMTEDENGIRD